MNLKLLVLALGFGFNLQTVTAETIRSCPLSLTSASRITLEDHTSLGFFARKSSQLPPHALTEIAGLMVAQLSPAVPLDLKLVRLTNWRVEHFVHRILVAVKLELIFANTVVSVEVTRHFNHINLKSLSGASERSDAVVATAHLVADIVNHASLLDDENSLGREAESLRKYLTTSKSVTEALSVVDVKKLESALLEAARPRLLETDVVSQGYLLREYFYVKERLARALPALNPKILRGPIAASDELR